MQLTLFPEVEKSMSIVSERLKKARERKGLKQVDVFERTKINNKTLSRYENDGSEPDLQTLVQLADLYEVTTDWLLGRVDHPLHYAYTEDAQSAVMERGLDYSGVTEDDIEWFENFIKEYKKIKNK